MCTEGAGRMVALHGTIFCKHKLQSSCGSQNNKLISGWLRRLAIAVAWLAKHIRLPSLAEKKTQNCSLDSLEYDKLSFRVANGTLYVSFLFAPAL